MKHTSADIKIVLDFIDAINQTNLDLLYGLMSKDHMFIDSRGDTIFGSDNMKKAWTDYFNIFPNYKIEITDTLQKDAIVVVLGHAHGTYNVNNNNDKANYWEIPAAWKAMVVDKKIKLWQVYADNSVVLEIINKNK